MSKDKKQKKGKKHAAQDENNKIDFEDKYKRALADYQNLLARTAKEKTEFIRYANEQVIMEFIPVYDNLKMAIAHAGEDNDSWLEGVKYTVKQFAGVLKDLGVEEVNTKGEKFDPNTMEAVEGKGDKVKKEIKSGYKLRDKIIVPAKVIVG